jgi:copper oxidase (laccase) domain-containing protein
MSGEEGKIKTMQPVIVKDIDQAIRVGYSGKLLGNTHEKFGPDADRNLGKFMSYFPGKTPQILGAVGGDIILEVDHMTPAELAASDYDVAITTSPQNLLILNAADCIPLVFYRDEKDFVALAHVGTSGAALHLPSKVIKTLGAPPEELRCYVGPSISQKSYRFEKGTFKKQLDRTWDDYITDEADGVHLNLLGYVLDELKTSGTRPENIKVEEVDTGGDADYFSHRRHQLTGEPDGRNCFAVCLM